MKTLLVAVLFLSVAGPLKAASLKSELGGAPYIGTHYGSKLGLEVGSSYPVYGLSNADGDEELRLSANLAFPLGAQFAGDAAAGLSLGVPIGSGDLIEVHSGANIIFVSHVPHGGEVFFGFQSKAVVQWFVGLFSKSQ